MKTEPQECEVTKALRSMAHDESLRLTPEEKQKIKTRLIHYMKALR